MDKIWAWNSSVPEAVHKCVHDLIAERVQAQPDASAVFAHDGELTYKELDVISNQLGQHLSRSVEPDTIVPLCFEKSMWTAVTILAVLKASCAFVLLDASQPEARLRSIFQQTHATVICSSAKNHSLSASLVEGIGEVILVGPDFLISNQLVNGFEHSLPPSNPSSISYVVFTSGSTGTPKGVAISHTSICSAFYYQLSDLGFRPGVRVFEFASYSFDVAVHNALATLVSGATLCVPSDIDRVQDPAGAMAAMGVTLANLTPSVGRLIDPSRVPNLQTLIFLGEALGRHDAQRWWGKTRIVNTYGPAECTPISTIDYAVRNPSDVSEIAIGIGVGAITWVVDPENHDILLPPYSIGELLIEGPLVGWGYLDDHEKTDSAFITSPSWLREYRQSRLYKTGDLVQYRADGSLRFIGRKDAQVKIHGQRVELGEVEYHVQACFPGASQTVVEVVGTKQNPMLVAFLQWTDRETPGFGVITVNNRIANEMSSRLPAYMTPGLFFAVVDIPQTPSGKTDRKRLRELGSSLFAQRPAIRTKRQPTSKMERQLQSLWAKVLEVDDKSLGLDDSFISLGGDSLAAIRLVGEARKSNIALRVEDVFKESTLEAQARVAGWSTVTQPIVPFSLVDSTLDVEDLANSLAVHKSLVEDAYPCTPLQEGLLSLTLQSPGDYVLQTTISISKLDLEAFKGAWEHAVQTNATLRTRIVEGKSGLLQVVLKQGITWAFSGDLEEYLQNDKHTAMNLGQPLSRFALISDSQDKPTWLVLTLHHALYDGWSLDLLTDMVNDAYVGHPAVSSTPEFNAFVKYVIDTRIGHASNTYWLGALRANESTTFPAMRTRERSHAAYRRMQKTCEIPQGLIQKAEVTPSTLIRAALALSIGRHTNTTDVIFGATVSGRNAPVPGIEKVVGPTIATVPFRVRLDSPKRTVFEYLRTLQDQATEMIPFEQAGLQHISKLGDDPRRACEFQTLLVVQPQEDEAEEGTFGKWQSDAEQLTTYALTLECFLDRNGFKINARFNSAAIEPWRLQKMLGQMELILTQLADASYSSKRVEDLNMLPPHDMSLLRYWNANVPPVIVKCLPELFREKVQQLPPSHQAICSWEGALTYEELDAHSDILASHLITLGVTKEVLVPVCFEKSMWTVVAMLAVLKAGGGFVPIDNSWPNNRKQHILQETKTDVIITSKKYSSLFVDSECHIIPLDFDFLQTLPKNGIALVMALDPGSIAYVIFTSGTTGTPKGVMLEHRAVSSSCTAHGRAFGFNSGSRVLQFSAYTFDACVAEIFTTLIFGGTICIPSDSDRLSNLAGAISTLDVNWTFLTTSVARLLEPEAVPGIKTILFGGEPNMSADYERWMTNQRRVVGVYGPTECCVYCAGHDASEVIGSSLLGRPVGSVGWVVEPGDHNKLAPLGAIGELLVEGPTLARGYLNDKEKTALAFIENPSWLVQDGPGYKGRIARLYKTGDLVQYTSNGDGTLRYMGRKDTQVKIHGQRADLSEVEHHVKQSISEAKQVIAEVIPSEDERSNDILVAFAQVNRREPKPTSNGETESSGQAFTLLALPSDVKDLIARQLPGYMIPRAYFCVTKELPRMASSGKTDRRRLREIGAMLYKQHLTEILTSGSEKRQPLTEAERKLQNLWARVLNISNSDSIGVDNNFFQLGGDSVTVMKLVAQARRENIALTVADVFRMPTLALQAQVDIGIVDDRAGQITPFSLLGRTIDVPALCSDIALSYGNAIDPFMIEDLYPCTPLQEGLLSLASKHAGDYIQQSVLKLAHDIRLDAFKAAWEETVRLAPVLRTRIVHHQEFGLVQIVLRQEIQWIETEETLEDYLEKDKVTPRDLGQSFAQFALLESNARPQYFVWTMHHALYDGWSLSLVIDLFNRLYTDRQQTAQRSPFTTFVRYVEERKGEEADSYWRLSLQDQDSYHFPSIPPAVREPVANCTLECECKLAVSETAMSSDLTTSTIIRAALAVVISRHTGSTDVVFGTTLSGRNAPVAGITDIIGPTICTVPIRIQTEAGNRTTTTQFLHQVQRQAAEMIPWEQTGLQHIGKLSEDTHSVCQFQTLLVIQTAEDEIQPDSESGTWETHEQLGFTTYAITLECFVIDVNVRIRARFDSRVVDVWKMERILEQFSFAMEQFAAAATGRTMMLADVDLLSAADNSILQHWNSELPNPSVNRCVHELIREQARARPNQTAVYGWDGELSHAQLNELSDRLGQHLIGFGVGPEILVPLCFPKSSWTIVAMLGVMKAGGAFVLLDPSHPEGRLQMLCERTAATVAVASPSTAEKIDSFVGDVVVIDQNMADWLPQLYPSSSVRVSPTDSAYVIFTSGSTGAPKGCKIEHRSYCSAALNHGSVMTMSTNTRALQFGSYSFAGAIMEILMTLIYGGCVCVPSDEDRQSRLESAIIRLQANWAFLTSTVLRSLSPEMVPCLRTVCIGGEAIHAAQIPRWSRSLHLRQTYGSAETSAVVSSAHLTEHASTTDVGRPTTGRYWLVDSSDIDRLAPLGAAGEVVIEGPTIGREYLGEPEKTAAAFIKAPAWRRSFGAPETGSRFYRTGDVATYTADGAIQLLGRRDFQVKVRGQRIELGEIEHQARSATTDLKEFVVEKAVPKDGDDKAPMLVGFMVVRDTSDEQQHSERSVATLEAVRAKLQAVLPQYMVPSVFLQLSELPKTISKKTDRQRLREIASSYSRQELLMLGALDTGDKRQPTTDRERKLQSLWSRVLDIKTENIGLEDSFFEIGGDSISALKLVGEAHQNQFTLAMADVFREPTLAAQAQAGVAPPTDNQIRPFTLLGHNSSGILQLLRELATPYGLDPSSIEDAYPCTPLQEGLLSLTSKNRGDYVMQSVLELSEDVDLEEFQSAWDRTVSLVATLRTRVVQHNTLGLVQLVTKTGVEWRRSNDDLNDFLTKDKVMPMDLGRPLSRFVLLSNETNRPRWFIWTAHHAIFDGWSLPLVLDIVKAAYLGKAMPGRKDFTPFIAYLQQTGDREVETYWQSELANSEATPFPSLPTPVHKPTADRTMERRCELPSKSGRSEATLSTLIRAALGILISRHTNSADVIFGAVLSGRNAPVTGIDNIVGPTIATVPIRAYVPGDQPISEYLRTLQRQAIDMINFEQTGLQNIARFNKIAYDFQTLLVVQPEDQQKVDSDETFGAWRLDPEQLGFTTYALTITCSLSTDTKRVHVSASFDSSVVGPWKVEKMLEQLCYVMQQLVSAATEETISGIDLQTPQDLTAVWESNATVPPLVERCVHELIRERTKLQPDAIAISSWDGEMTYSELDILSDHLAAHLSKLGVTILNALIPLCFEKSLWTVVAVLAVMKAGGASVTMDTTQPTERLRTIVQQTDQQLVLCSIANERLATDLLRDKAVVVVGRTQMSHLPPPGASQPSNVSPASRICVLFTSGSTGLPKGAVILHSNFATATKYQSAAFGYVPGARIFAFASYSFDISWFDTVHTLVNGATLCIPSEVERKDDLEGALIRSKATVAFMTPSVARLLRPNTVPSLRCLALGGEPQRWADFSSWPEQVKKLSVYGPAECTVVSSAQDARILEKRDMTLPTNIGLNAWLVDPLNDRLLTPRGSVGEIYLEGALVGAGYVGNPQQTAAAFIEDPPWLLRGSPNHPGRRGRLYRTGDMAQYNEDGSLSFAGRKDNQVKIRGQRVELTEIEHHIRRSNSGEAKQVVVEIVNLAGEQNSSTLVAFIETPEESKMIQDTMGGSSSETKAQPEAKLIKVRSEVVEELSSHLPSYMVPRIYFAIPSVPRTVNGKTDRRKLREIGSQFSMQQLADVEISDAQIRQPINPTEVHLQHLWAQILHIKPGSIGLDDNFFQLGGDSIAAMKVVGQANKDGFAGLTVADIFRQPYLAAQAQIQTQSQESGDIKEVRRAIPAFSLLHSNVDARALCEKLVAMYNIGGSIEDVYPCTPLQEGLLSLTSKHAGDYVLQNVLELPNEDDFQIEVFKAAWEETVRSIALLRTRVLQYDSFGLVQMLLEHQGIDWHWALNEELEDYLHADKLKLMEFGQPLTRFALVGQRSRETPRWFVWTIHHALYDGWSLPLLMDRVIRTYLRRANAFSENCTNAKGMHTDDIAMSSATENGDLGGKNMAQQKVEQQDFGPDFKAFVQYVERSKGGQSDKYWRSTFAQNQSTPFPTLPAAVSQPLADGMTEHECGLSLEGLRTSNITISTLVRGALAMLISRSTGVPEAIFGATISGRNAPVPGIEEMAGPTIATVPIRVQVTGDTTVPAYLDGLQHQATKMIPHEQSGLQNIAKLGEDARTACNFQTLLVVQPLEDPLHNEPQPDQHKFGIWRTNPEQLGFTTYALTIQCFLTAEGVRFRASFDTRVINPWSMGRLLTQLSFLTVQLSTARPNITVGEVESLPLEDRETIWEWNSTVPALVERCVHELVEDRVRERPSSSAVCAWDGDLTYHQLNSRSHQLALHLVESGVTPGVIVPLCFEKSLWTVIAMLAVLKAGAAFVLLDAETQPEARLATIVKQANAKNLCSSVQRESLSRRLLDSVEVVGPESMISPRPGTTLPRPDPSNPLYLIFTSGSTGEPKGAILPHTSFASALRYQLGLLNFTNRTRTYDFASYSFDVAVHNVLSTLASGGCLCVPSESDRKSRTAESMESLKANAVSLTASVARLIDPSQVPTLDTLTFLGEPVSQDDAERWWGKVRLITSYGPAECTPTSTVNSSATSPAAVRSLGTGVGVCTWIVDPENHDVLLPLSQVGELVLEGPLLGNGYLNHPEKTAAAFIKDPAWLVAGAAGRPGRRGRLYKTGDLVRYNEDGTLQIVGRKDSQIKVRGQRLELEDVEHSLRECLPGTDVVAEAVRPAGTTSVVLVAFICLTPPKSDREMTQTTPVIDESALTQMASIAVQLDDRMSKRLPTYMVPTAYVPVTQIPMTPTGKTNRHRLRELGMSLTKEQLEEMRGHGAGPKKPVETEQEQTIQTLWARVLKIPTEKIGRDDSFFGIGGNSIDAMKVVGEARRLGMHFTVADMFRHSSISDLTGNLRRDGDRDETMIKLATPPPPFSLVEPSTNHGVIASLLSHTPDVRPEHIKDILPTTDFQAQTIDRGIELPSAALNYFWLDLGADVDSRRLRDSCQALLDHYSVLRGVFVPFSDKHWQVMLEDCDVQFSTLIVDGDLQPACESICLRDSHKGLSMGRLSTAFMLAHNQFQQHRLIIRLSHAQYDGLCLPLMLQTLADLYHGHQVGPSPQFSTYLAHLLNQRASSSVYWARLLPGSRPSPIVPLLSRNTNLTNPLEKVHAETTVSLPEPADGTSVASLVASSWAVICSLVTGKDDVVFGHVVSGREAVVPGVQDIVGPCVNIIPVRVKLNTEQTCTGIVRTTQDQLVSLGQTGLMMGWEDILRCSTNWPAGSKLDSIVQHQNINEHPDFEIAGTRARLDWYDNPDAVYSHLNIASYPEDEQLRIKIMANSHMMTSNTAATLARCLCETVRVMASGGDRHIPSVFLDKIRMIFRPFNHP